MTPTDRSVRAHPARALLRPLALGPVSGLVALGLLAGCETRPADPRNVPLRDVRTSSDARYVQCVARDPLFQTPECRQVRLETRAGNNR